MVLKRLFGHVSDFRNEKRSNDRSVHDRERVANFDSKELKPGNIKTGGLNSQYGNIKSEMQSQRSTGQASFKQEARNLTCADDDEDEDALLINCDLNILKPQATNSRPFQMNNNNNVNQLKSTNEIYQSFRGANQPSGNIKRPPSTDCISSISDSYSNRSNSSGMVSKTATASVLTKKPKIDMMAIDDKDDDDDFETDFRAIKAAASVESAAMSHSSSRSSNISTKSSSSDRIQGNQAAVKSRPNLEQFKQQLAEKEDSSNQPINISSLLELQENCCLFNVPDPSGDEPGALATCEHEIRCQVKTLTAQLKQVKLKWHQECILADDTNDSLAAYISDEPMSQLLEMTCAQAKELFIKSRQQSQNPQSKPTEDYNTIFTRRRKNCEEVLKNNTFLMRLSYDFPRGNYCVVKLTKL